MMWGVRRHDVGDTPSVWIMEGNEAQAEENARSMVKSMTEVANEKGWDNAPELVQCRLMWKVVDPEPYPSNVKCVCGDLIHPDQPFVELQADGSLFHWNEHGGGHRFDVDLT
jgi:hypothetical protein